MDLTQIERSRRGSSEKLICVPHSMARERAARPPNRRRHEEQMEELLLLIHQKEEGRTGMLEEARLARDQLAQARTQRDQLTAQKNAVYEKLDTLNKEVQKQGENVRRLRGGLVYLSEAEVDAQIRKLEYQIERNNFKLPDERRIVAEIDRLRRSKKTLREHDALKEQLDRLRESQRLCRQEREEIFRFAKEAKRQEDGLRQRSAHAAAEADQLRLESEELKEERRSLAAAYRAQELEFRRALAAKREEGKRRAAMEKEQEIAVREQEQQEIANSCEPYLEEINLCTLLIQHCQKLQGSGSQAPTPVDGAGSFLLGIPSLQETRRRSSGFSAYSQNSDCSSYYATPLGCSPATTPLNGTPPGSLDAPVPGFYKKKEEHEEVFFPGSAKKKPSKKGGRANAERRLSVRKSLTHSPEIFNQFSRLGLSPPASIAEIGSLLDQLRARLKLYQRMAEQELAARRPGSAAMTQTQSSGGGPIPAIVVDSMVATGLDSSSRHQEEESVVMPLLHGSSHAPLHEACLIASDDDGMVTVDWPALSTPGRRSPSGAPIGPGPHVVITGPEPGRTSAPTSPVVRPTYLALDGVADTVVADSPASRPETDQQEQEIYIARLCLGGDADQATLFQPDNSSEESAATTNVIAASGDPVTLLSDDSGSPVSSSLPYYSLELAQELSTPLPEENTKTVTSETLLTLTTESTDQVGARSLLAAESTASPPVSPTRPQSSCEQSQLKFTPSPNVSVLPSVSSIVTDDSTSLSTPLSVASSPLPPLHHSYKATTRQSSASAMLSTQQPVDIAILSTQQSTDSAPTQHFSDNTPPIDSFKSQQPGFKDPGSALSLDSSPLLPQQSLDSASHLTRLLDSSSLLPEASACTISSISPSEEHLNVNSAPPGNQEPRPASPPPLSFEPCS